MVWKLDAIDYTQLLASGGEHRLDAGLVPLLADPVDGEQRDDILLEYSQSREAEPMLQKRARFHQHVVVRQKCRLIIQKLIPAAGCTDVVFVIMIDHSVEGGGIDENVHPW